MNCPPVVASKEHIESFRENGYVCLRRFFPPEIGHDLRKMSDEMSLRALVILQSCRRTGLTLADRAKENPSELIVVPEMSSPMQICRYEFMIGSNLKFGEFVRSCLEPMVTQLVGETVTPFKDKTNEKLSGGGAFPPHQDIAAYQTFGARYHATAVLTIDPANVANGCLQFATNFEELVATEAGFVMERVGGKAVLHYQKGGPHNGDIRPDITAKLKWQILPTNPLDLIVFDSFVPHYSDANESNEPRRAIFVTFNRASEGSFYEDYYADKRLNYGDPKFHVSTPTSHRGSKSR